jgi:hypothetical protein
MKYLYCNETNELITKSEKIIPNEKGFFVLENIISEENENNKNVKWKLYTPKENLRLEE